MKTRFALAPTTMLLLSLAASACTSAAGPSEPTGLSSEDMRRQPAAESPSGTTIPPATSIVDSQKGRWSVRDGVVYVNGAPAGYSANVTLLLYFDGTIYQENSAGGWWSWNGSGWADASDPRAGGVGGGGGDAGSTAPSGSFTVSIAGFHDADGKPWSMRGLNAGVDDARLGFGNLLHDYPGLTAIRLNCDPAYDSDDAIAAVVETYTGAGIVVEVEDHSGVGDNVAWYQDMATRFRGNARVFLETPNEPGAPNTADNQIAILRAIHAAAFPNPIGLQPIGGYDYSNVATVLGAVGATQLFLTPHVYDSGDDPNGPRDYVASDIQGSLELGLYPVIDEFGDALDGFNRDPYGPQVITAVIDATQGGQAGAVFWAMDNGNHADGADSAFLVPDGSQLTSVGTVLQSWLK